MDISFEKTTTDTPGQRLRSLPVNEWPLVTEVILRQGGALPDPALAGIIVLEETDTEGIVQTLGFIVIRLVPHLEPYVTPALRSTGAWEDLVHAAISQFSVGAGCFYLLAPTKPIATLCERVGLLKLPGTVYRGENLPPEPPPVEPS